MTAAPWIERAARLGYFSIGVVYIIVGLMTAAAAMGIGGKAANWTDAIAEISAMPLGTIALLIIGIGLLGYSVWLVSSAITDSDQRGRDAKGLMIRAGAVAAAVIHVFIAAGVFHLARTHTSSSSSGSDISAKEWTGRVMEMPFGRWLVGIAGLAFLGYAVYALTRAWEAKLSDRLHLPVMQARPLIVAICRFGIAGRAIVVGVIGASLVGAALHQNPSRTEAIRGALINVAQAPYGHPLLLIVSLGLAAYGLYAIVKARYRAIQAT
ncbi:MAG TPA: DUF1206 domain-containing protein [Thermoanaerobaculia bacterium]